ncbi:MAG: hypothetical protein CVV61_04575 [Tenericutes bacterium HGW-Tenericutes-6]|nr:MAG: hypothetical protein CVV61_04575 [Tenericutes bacterium HGW-Tenericutes-6]
MRIDLTKEIHMITLHLNPSDQIQTILDDYPLDEKIEIFLEAGVYHQKLRLKHHHLKISGSKTKETLITNGDYSYKMHEDGLLYNTFRTETVMILGDYVTLEHLTIENHSGRGLTIGQAVALTLYGTHTRIDHVILKGHQDTLFIGPLPKDLCERYDHFLPIEERKSLTTEHLFTHTTIYGDVDFIFGSGTAYFLNCHIIATNQGYIAAPSTYEDAPYGFVFMDSLIESKTLEPVTLARPWRAHGATHFINCTFKGSFSHHRYDAWDKDTFRFFESPYQGHPLSKPIKEEEIEQLRALIQKLI